MAKIVYGVHGTGHGHAIRALTVAELFPEHDFLFFSHADGLNLLQGKYAVREIPNPVTPVSGHRVAVGRMLLEDLKFVGTCRANRKKVQQLVNDFQADFGITDYEYFIPQACRKLHIPCISIDNQHVITKCRHRLPLKQHPSYLITANSIKKMFSSASCYLISSFFQPRLKINVKNTMIIPPFFRKDILCCQPKDLGHVVAFQGYSTFPGFIPFLKKINRKVKIFGLGTRPDEDNLEFNPFPDENFAETLAKCSYVICGGGHTLISEALYYRKPVLAFPVSWAFEQYLNAHYLELSGFGLNAGTLYPDPNLIKEFEKNLDIFRGNIAQIDFYGNDILRTRLKDFFQGKFLQT